MAQRDGLPRTQREGLLVSSLACFLHCSADLALFLVLLLWLWLVFSGGEAGSDIFRVVAACRGGRRTRRTSFPTSSVLHFLLLAGCVCRSLVVNARWLNHLTPPRGEAPIVLVPEHRNGCCVLETFRPDVSRRAVLRDALKRISSDLDNKQPPLLSSDGSQRWISGVRGAVCFLWTCCRALDTVVAVDG